MANSALITGSQGYLGVFTDVAYARSAPYGGAYGRYAVQNSATFNVIVDSGIARGVIVKAGRVWGDGIYDEITTDVSLQFDLPAAGTTVYGAVVITRDWTAKTSTLRAVLGTTNTAQPPAGLGTNAGLLSDQVVALVRVVAASPLVDDVRDRRCWVESYRSSQATGNVTQALAGGAPQSLVGITTQLVRQGEYRIFGTAVVQGTGNAVTDGSLTLNAQTGPDAIDLVGQSVTVDGTKRLFTVQKTHYHLGGLLSANLGLVMPGTWGGGNVMAGAYLSASWVGPYPT